jgi:hypothetical protein
MNFRLLLGVLLGAGLIAAMPAAAKGPKLPQRLTTPTGNFITLYAFNSNGHVEKLDVGVCASSHTPTGTEAIPEFFTLSLSNGSSVRIAGPSAKMPALRVTPLKPKQCVRGWLSFALPKGAHAVALVYTYGKPIRWRLA